VTRNDGDDDDDDNDNNNNNNNNNVEYEMLCHASNHWGHRNCEQKFTKISGNNTRTTLNRFVTKTAILGT
jgi:hypothetical protein